MKYLKMIFLCQFVLCGTYGQAACSTMIFQDRDLKVCRSSNQFTISQIFHGVVLGSGGQTRIEKTVLNLNEIDSEFQKIVSGLELGESGIDINQIISSMKKLKQ